MGDQASVDKGRQGDYGSIEYESVGTIGMFPERFVPRFFVFRNSHADNHRRIQSHVSGTRSIYIRRHTQQSYHNDQHSNVLRKMYIEVKSQLHEIPLISIRGQPSTKLYLDSQGPKNDGQRLTSEGQKTKRLKSMIILMAQLSSSTLANGLKYR
jgi:hypothetical protein